MSDPAIRLAGGQLDDPPPYAIPFFAAIGFALIHWARLEQQIDVLLISVNKESHSVEKYRPTPNTSFRLKCDLFERWFVKDPRFAEHRHNAKRLHKSFANANEDRRLLVHSNVQEFRQGPPPTVIFRNLVLGKDTLKVSKAEWTEEEILTVARTFSGLNRGLYTITEKVLTRDFLESLRTA